MFEAVIFDMDGTLTVLTLPLEAMRRDTKDIYIRRGLPPELLDPADGISSSTLKAKEYFLNNGMQSDEWDRLQSEVDEVLSKHESGAARGARAIEGALDVVKRIRQKGFKTAILTNNGREAVNLILGQLPLDPLFDIIQTRHESPSPKPYPEGLMHILERLNISANHALYVGDARIDGVAAKRAGIEFWGVTTGETKADVLKSAGASNVFDSLSELFAFLESYDVGQQC